MSDVSDTLIVSLTSSIDGHSSERSTGLPAVSWPTGSVVRSVSMVPASA